MHIYNSKKEYIATVSDVKALAPGLFSGDIEIGIGYIRIGLASNNITIKWDGTITKTVNGTITMQKNIDAL
nr:MAG TPA: hypothetical protein [Caudoviricetes sp.]